MNWVVEAAPYIFVTLGMIASLLLFSSVKRDLQEHALSRFHTRWYPMTLVFLAFVGFASQGFFVGGNSPAEYRAFIEREIPKWARIVKEANVKVE